MNRKFSKSVPLIFLKVPKMMNKSILIALFFFSVNVCLSQSVQDIIDQVSTDNIQQSVAELSGEQPAVINGSSQTISSRVETNNDLAATYIEERLSALTNLDVEIQNFNTNGKNIIATQLGKTNADDVYIICAHYDSVTTFCADDNATGVSAVLEIARILSTQCTDKTIVYALWDEEEVGLRGSNFYAQQAADTSNGNARDNILGVINMDMIGYDGDAPGTDGDNEFDIDVRNIANSIAIKDDLLNLLNTYSFDLSAIVVNPGTSASDHSRFWNQDYSAVLVGESWETDDQTPDYHSSGDRAEDLDFQYMTELTKLVASYIATKANLLTIDNTISQNADNLSANDNSENSSYQWIDCNTNSVIDGENNRVFTPTSSGNYSVLVSDSTCSEQSDCLAFTLLNTKEFTTSEILVYPNPVSSVLKVENNTGLDVDILINDISGKVIHSSKSKNASIEIDVKNKATGIYFVTISSNLKSSTFKILKE